MILKTLGRLYYLLLIASFAMWFGGLGFYISFVVPTGTEVLGGAFEQGMITRRVTPQLNGLAAIALILMLIEPLLFRARQLKWQLYTKLVTVTFMLVMLAVLVWLHPRIDAFINVAQHQMTGDYDRFYLLHRGYLWATTFQWLAGWVWMVALVAPFPQSTISPPTGEAVTSTNV